MNLFTPIIPPERFHKNFVSCIEQRNPHDEAVIAKWANGFVDRDGKFVEEFQSTFNSSFWELYLHAVLKEAGCQVDFSYHAPDFVVTDPMPFVVEATVALNAQDALPEWASFDLALHPHDLNEFNRVAMVRLLNSISEKTKKYNKSYRNLPHVADKPFVLALTPFDQPFFYLQVQRAIEAVLYDFYVDEQEQVDNSSRSVSIPAKNLKTVRKRENVELPLGIFNDNSHAHISAVIFNSAATWGKVRAMCDDPNPFIFFSAFRHDPRSSYFYAYQGAKASYTELLLDGLRVYHNPHATYPLDWSVFQRPGVLQAMYTNPQIHTWQYWMDRPPLIARNLATLNVAGIDMKELQKKMSDELKGGWYKRPFSSAMFRQEIDAMQTMQRRD